MVQPNIEGDLPHAVLILPPDRYEMPKRVGALCVTRIA
jgi:hypothetical protein